MEEIVLSEGQSERFILEALVDYGYGELDELEFHTYISEDDQVSFELDTFDYYRGEKLTKKHVFTIRQYVELLKHSLNKNGYDTDRVSVVVKRGKLKVKVKTNIATPGYSYKKRRKR